MKSANESARENAPPVDHARFCMRCGQLLTHRHCEGVLRPLCEKCGWIFYRNPASASAAVIPLPPGVVLIKRSIPPFPGSWCLPAGFQEYDESPEEAAIREVKEETNMEVRLERLLKVYFSTMYPGKNTVVHIYLARHVGGVMRAGDDAAEVAAFPLDRLPENIAFKSHLKVIEEFTREYMKP